MQATPEISTARNARPTHKPEGVAWAQRSARRSRLAGLGLVSPSLALVALVFVVPLVVLIVYSVFRYTPGGTVEAAFQAGNYDRVFTSGFNMKVMVRSLGLGACVASAALVLGLPVAYLIARSPDGTMRSVLYGVLLVPLLTSVVVKSYGWQLILGESGLINGALRGMGMERVRLLYTFSGTVIALASMLLPFMVISLVPVIQAVHPNLELAARSLGAGRLRAVLDVTLPIAAPGMSAGFLIVFVLAVGSYAAPALVGGGKVLTVPVYIYDQALGASLNMPFAAALGTVLLVIVLALTALQSRLLGMRRKWAGHE